ncbi:hypothetical protein R1sor_019502 [Riccia sorocarpa]|uniref:Uncharacterized protein n=1 Tax=Riccia sorocarpa TaxID=122646 RepID=A0ABD3IGH3_9MARC
MAVYVLILRSSNPAWVVLRGESYVRKLVWVVRERKEGVNACGREIMRAGARQEEERAGAEEEKLKVGVVEEKKRAVERAEVGRSDAAVVSLLMRTGAEENRNAMQIEVGKPTTEESIYRSQT